MRGTFHIGMHIIGDELPYGFICRGDMRQALRVDGSKSCR
jgi:hypothetical protein